MAARKRPAAPDLPELPDVAEIEPGAYEPSDALGAPRQPGSATGGGRGSDDGRAKLVQYAQRQSLAALKLVREMMDDPETKAGDRIRCAEMLLAYAHGKPSTTSDTGATEVVVTLQDSAGNAAK